MGIKLEKVNHIYKGITKNTDYQAIYEIDLDIKPNNELIAICGKTGSGKSTLIQHLNALLLPSSGKVTIFDYEITDKKKRLKAKKIREKVGLVFQFPEYQLFEETVLKDILFGPKNFGHKSEEAHKKALEIAKMLKIENILEQSPFKISGGQMRRVAIAGILAIDPEILVLDEPTRGLDPQGKNEIMQVLKNLVEIYHKTVIIITHDMDIVYEYASRLVVLEDGYKVYDGNKEAFFEENLHKKYHLDKPDILKTIDHLNEMLKTNLDYSHYTISDLLNALRKWIK